MSIYEKKGKYYCRFQINGERHHYKCNGATSIKEAQKIENQYIYKVQQQQNGVIPKEEKKILLKQLYDFYEKYARLNKKTWQEDSNRLNIIRDIWKNKKYAEEVLPKLHSNLLLNFPFSIVGNDKSSFFPSSGWLFIRARSFSL